jgi:hypothetical protein
VFTRGQAVRCGYGAGAVDAALRCGQWVALRRGVYAPAPLPADPAGALLVSTAAAVLGLRGGAVASHETAAVLHDLPVVAVPDRPVLTLPRKVTPPRRESDVDIHAAALPEGHVTARRGIPVTSVARTVVDLGRWLPFRYALITADAALRAGPTDRDDLIRILAACKGWPGVRSARRVVNFADPAAESPLESVCRAVFAEQGLPPPECQAWLEDGTGWSARVDFLWPRYRTVVEADGMVKYTDPEVLRAEKLRQERLEALGYTVIRTTWTDITRTPTATANRIRHAFTRTRTLPRTPPA